MLNIEKYLEKFFKNVNSTELYKKQIIDTIEKHIQIKLLSKDIEIKNYTVFIKASPSVLNKIFVFKNRILEDLTNLILDLKIIDIR